MEITPGTKITIEWLGLRAGVVETWTVTSGQTKSDRFQISKDSALVSAIARGEDSYTTNGSLRVYFRVIEIANSAGNEHSVAARPNTILPADLIPSHLSTLLQRALGDYFRYKISNRLPELNDKDIQLSLKWLGMPQSLSRTQLIAEHGENYQLARMLSARAAEKAVIHFFESMLMGEINDISISQLADPESQGNWRQYDILSDGNAYDVKNSRRTARNPDNYVEHCVPKYKEYRGQSVKMAGTLSPYLKAKELLDQSLIPYDRFTSIRVLGFTDASAIEKLIQYFSRDHFSLEFRHPHQKSNFLPPWIFDYPASYYSKRDSGLESIIKTIKIENWIQTGRNPVPVYLALGLEPPVEWQQTMNYSWQVDFVQRFLRSHKEFDLSLPAVYLTVLTHFLDCVNGNLPISQNYDPSQYRKLLFIPGEAASPLFLHDPLETINNLISNLTVLWEAKSKRISDYSSFRLVSAGILRARLASNPNVAHSLVAYCGGRTKDRWPCGNVPLVLGRHPHCEQCGMLICDKCGHCSSTCSNNASRQANFDPSKKVVALSYNDGADDEIPFEGVYLGDTNAYF